MCKTPQHHDGTTAVERPSFPCQSWTACAMTTSGPHDGRAARDDGVDGDGSQGRGATRCDAPRSFDREPCIIE